MLPLVGALAVALSSIGFDVEHDGAPPPSTGICQVTPVQAANPPNVNHGGGESLISAIDVTNCKGISNHIVFQVDVDDTPEPTSE